MSENQTYKEKLLDKTFNELQESLEGVQKNQANTHSDLFWWSYETEMEHITNAQMNLMKKQVEILCKRYGYRPIQNHIINLVDVAKKEKELLEAKSKVK